MIQKGEYKKSNYVNCILRSRRVVCLPVLLASGQLAKVQSSLVALAALSEVMESRNDTTTATKLSK